ncbi:hypothetical protein [Salegentibacter chungangensis]|uniref:DUF4377 domain-containing protein n=1 Tax=Salegentibacter chungangensis TaxID=1335724 RepID=A0ABW3NU16_9FLAO
MKNLLTLLSVMLLILGCSDDGTPSEKVNIRLRNLSSYDFSNVVVGTPGGTVNYGNIPSRGITEYESFETAYRYAFIELQIDGDTFTIQPIDYVGETPLENGNYTYEINANDSQERYGRLILRLRED